MIAACMVWPQAFAIAALCVAAAAAFWALAWMWVRIEVQHEESNRDFWKQMNDISKDAARSAAKDRK